MSVEFNRFSQEKTINALALQKKLGTLMVMPDQQKALVLATNSKDTFRHRFLASPDYNPSWVSSNTRKIFFDIEGYHLDDKHEDGFGLATSIDEQGNQHIWQRDQINDLITHLLSYDEIVTFGGLDYDNWVLANEIGVDSPLIKQLFDKSFDLQQFASVISPIQLRYRVSLDKFATNVIGRGKKDLRQYDIERKDIPYILKDGTGEEKRLITEYCMEDSLLLRDIYQFFQVNQLQKSAVLSQLVDQTVCYLDDWRPKLNQTDEIPAYEVIDLNSTIPKHPFGKSLRNAVYPNEFREIDISDSDWFDTR